MHKIGSVCVCVCVLVSDGDMPVAVCKKDTYEIR